MFPENQRWVLGGSSFAREDTPGQLSCRCLHERFKAFLRITFGDEHYEENLTFLENGLKELEDYEHKIRYPLAARQVEIDLDDGVKVNNKFGKALKKVTGLTK